MYFLGQTFYRDDKSSSSALVDITNLNSIELDNGIYDDLFVTKDINYDITDSEKKWTFDTVLYAMFKNNLLAGNIDFALNTITSIRIKQREKGTINWIKVEDIPINSVEDLQFIRTYKYCKSNTDYEFAMMPVLNTNAEGNMSVVECTSKFDGVYLMEKDTALHMVLNFEATQQRNHSATTVQTLGRAKPFYITSGLSNYESGNINVTLIKMSTDDCSLDLENSVEYRKYANDILTDKRPKVLKFDDGRIYMVGIVDAIQQSSDTQVPITTFNWTEIGEMVQEDLVLNGFLREEVLE